MTGIRSRRVLKLALMLVCGLSLAGLTASSAQAQERRRSRRLIRIEELRIEGTIQKPQAFYILQRSNLNFEGLELKNSFLPKIIRSVEKAPF